METPSNLLPKPDKQKVHHLFNGIRNKKVNPDVAIASLQVEFNKAFAYIAACEGLNDELGAMLEAMEGANIGKKDATDSV